MMETAEDIASTENAERSAKVLNGNVDGITGNIDEPGPLIIRGDVLSGFSVRAHGSLEIKGNVEDASIDVVGDVTIHEGFTGSGKGEIKATGTVTLSHVRNQTILAGKDVYVASECINATIRAGGRICAPRAVVSGGKLDAAVEIELGDLGLAADASAKIRVGCRARIIERLAQIEKDLVNAGRQFREVKDAVYKLVKVKVDGGTLPPDKEALLGKLQAAQKLLPERIASVGTERVALQAELQKKNDARIVVHGTIQADAMVEINGARKILESAVSSAEFIEWCGVVEIHSLH